MNISSATASLASLLNVSAGRARPQPPPDPATVGGASDTAKAEFQQKLFARMDADSDGSVTKAELTSHFSTENMSTMLAAQETSAADIAEKIMGEADADGDGALSADEFAAAAPKRGPGGPGGPGGMRGAGGPPPGVGPGGAEDAESAATDLLSDLDTDGDGVLSAEELAAAFAVTASVSFADADAEGDGSVSESEYAATQAASVSQDIKDAIASLISEGDEDDDGKLSATELTSLFEQRLAERASYGPPAWMAEGLGAYAASGANTPLKVFATA